jgi:hypothetical protein
LVRKHVRLISLGLSTLYSVVAVLGYSLHSFVGCDGSACRDAACLEPVATQSDVSCEGPTDSSASEHAYCCHHHANSGHASRAKHERLSVLLAKSSHDPSTCSICSLLAQLKIGYTAVEFSAASEQQAVELFFAYNSAPYDSPIRLGDARGPPLQAA